MGGNAFKEYDTPRLSSSQYSKLREEIHHKLAVHFEDVATPVPDPGKTTHGDIDFLVHTSKAEDVQLSPEAIKEVIGAIECLVGSPTSNYLVLLDGIHAQVDVNRCLTLHQWAFKVFMHSYGRLGHMLSKMVLRFGLYLDFRGLYTFKPTPTAPAYCITTDLQTCLKMLNLSYDAYVAGFETREAFFQWLEQATVAGAPVKHGWRGSTTKETDGVMWEWHLRRRDERKVDIDQEETRTRFLRKWKQYDAYCAWKKDIDDKARRVAEEKAREAEIKLEIARRLATSSAKGKDKAAAAKLIRADVEKMYALAQKP